MERFWNHNTYEKENGMQMVAFLGGDWSSAACAAVG
jgi:hypothetical protein